MLCGEFHNYNYKNQLQIKTINNEGLNSPSLVASATAFKVEQKAVAHYTYEDIREQELKCKADRKRE